MLFVKNCGCYVGSRSNLGVRRKLAVGCLVDGKLQRFCQIGSDLVVRRQFKFGSPRRCKDANVV